MLQLVSGLTRSLGRRSAATSRSCINLLPLLLLVCFFGQVIRPCSSSCVGVEEAPTNWMGRRGDLTMLDRQVRGSISFSSYCSFTVKHFEMSAGEDVEWWGFTSDTDPLGIPLQASGIVLNKSYDGHVPLIVDLGPNTSLEKIMLIVLRRVSTKEDVGRAPLYAMDDPNFVPSLTLMPHCVQLNDWLRVRWQIEGDSVDFGIEGIVPDNSYLSLGPAAPGIVNRVMGGADCFCAGFYQDAPFVVDSFIEGYTPCNYGAVPLSNLVGTCDDYSWHGRTNGFDDWSMIMASRVEGVTFTRVRRKFVTGDKRDHVITPNVSQLYIWALGTASGYATNGEWVGPQMKYHGSIDGRQYGELRLLLSPPADAPLSAEQPCRMFDSKYLDRAKRQEECVPQVDGFSSKFDKNVMLVGSKVQLFWTANPTDTPVPFETTTKEGNKPIMLPAHSIRLGVRGLRPSTWLALGLGTQMAGSTAFIAWIDTKGLGQMKYYSLADLMANGIKADPSVTLTDYVLFQRPGGELSFEFTTTLAKIAKGSSFSLDESIPLLYASGLTWQDSPLDSDLHNHRSSSATYVNLASGESFSAGADSKLVIHGWLMVSAWIILVPVSVCAARYLRMIKSRLWFQVHRNMIIVVFSLMVAAVVLAFIRVHDRTQFSFIDHFTASTHSTLGLITCITFIVQVAFAQIPPKTLKQLPVKEEKTKTPNAAAASAGEGDNNGSVGESTVLVLQPPAKMELRKPVERKIWEFMHKRLLAVAAGVMAFGSCWSGYDELYLQGGDEAERYHISLIIMLTFIAVAIIIREVLLKYFQPQFPQTNANSIELGSLAKDGAASTTTTAATAGDTTASAPREAAPAKKTKPTPEMVASAKKQLWIWIGASLLGIFILAIILVIYSYNTPQPSFTACPQAIADSFTADNSFLIETAKDIAVSSDSTTIPTTRLPPSKGTGTDAPCVPYVEPVALDAVAPLAACKAHNLNYIGDKWCDSYTPYNTAECSWDGGDCCDLKVALFDCKDPSHVNFGKSAPRGKVAAPRNPRYQSCDRPTTEKRVVQTYNNFYEFGFSKQIAAEAIKSAGFLEAVMRMSPAEPTLPPSKFASLVTTATQTQTLDPPRWNIEISGLVEKPLTIDIKDVLAQIHLEERLYRHRCVEGWSIVVPWVGFPLSKLIDMVSPKADAAYVKFTSFLNTKESQYQSATTDFPWPYTEGLTMAEALNELTFITVGSYGEWLRAPNGAPLRLTVPWKYGFKSIKSITKIEFLPKESRPATFWNTFASHEYGFWANVNPEVRHPRWSQATERAFSTSAEVFDGSNVIPTTKFNGYGKYVEYLYTNVSPEEELYK